MTQIVLTAALIPLAGTALGSAFVLFMKNQMSEMTQRILSGFAAGIMTAASIWSLLIPALEASEGLGAFSFVPSLIGFWLGVALLLALDHIVPHIHPETMEAEGPSSMLKKNTKLMLAVVLHNVPEGMALGAVLAGLLQDSSLVTMASVLALSIGITIQNVPEGAIISMPLHANGDSRGHSFWMGTLSGAVEPVAAWITLFAFRYVQMILPYLLAFAAGAMMYVVVEELIPEMSQGRHSNMPAICFCVGFTLMMVLDVALG